MSDEHLDKIWENNPQYIRRFYDNLPVNEKLCSEIKYILSLELEKANIEVAQISARAKTLKSFCEKISRKSYDKPFDDITDFAGVRIVYLYSTSSVNIESIIEREFEVIEKVDKVLTAEDKFGYGALHYLVKIKDDQSGSRYNELRNKVCEIQVRTILQDAWAIVAHHLSYKQEADVPREILRKLNALSGLFETADDQFESIRNKRLAYQNQIQESLSEDQGQSLDVTANLDNLTAYLKWKYPERLELGVEVIAVLLRDLETYGYSNLADIDTMLNRTAKAALTMEEKDATIINSNLYASVGIVRVSASLINKDFRHNMSYPSYHIKKLERFEGLIQN